MRVEIKKIIRSLSRTHTILPMSVRTKFNRNLPHSAVPPRDIILIIQSASASVSFNSKSCFCFGTSAMAEPIVKIEQGQLKGKTGTDCKGGNFFSFQGIPYAKPPLGQLRFKAPLPPEPWNGILDATKEGSECYSRHMVFQNLIGSEDCLFLNVYTPELPTGSNDVLKPVMVWIHGGGFTSGSSKTELYGPEFLISEDVVVVSINYRLGLLGFLSLEEPSLGVPGNAGLKDMVMALKWVQKNIKQFKGDPNNVTIFGESAGGAAVHYLMLSPMAKGLFHRAIAQSGSALNIWAYGTRCAGKVAKNLGLDSNDERKILEFLQSIPVEKLFEGQESVKDGMNADVIRPFGPVVENPSNEEAFLPERPIEIITSGKYNMVPFMTGFTTREGMLFQIIQQRDTKEIKFVTDFEKAVPFVLELAPGSDASKQAAKKIKEFYYGNEEPSLENIDKFYLLETDNFFLRGIHSAIKHQVANSTAPIYFYRMSVESSLNVYKHLGKIQAPGVCHADDLGYLFKMLITPELEPGSVEAKSVHRFVKLWTTFARYGNPNPPKKDPLIGVEWKPVKQNEFHFLDIGENLTVGVNPEAERMAFWDEIYKMSSSPAASKL